MSPMKIIFPCRIFKPNQTIKMKKLFNVFKDPNAKTIISLRLYHKFSKNIRPLGLASLLAVILFSSCQKQDLNSSANDVIPMGNNKMSAENTVLVSYEGLNAQTLWQLQQVRAATARYRDIKNAIKDGYSDIMVDVENMGHHYMKTSIIDATFDIRQPEILVYNRNEDDSQELVAVEYAVPLTYARPEGFTDTSDVWKDDSGFPFWLLHAWVWAYNPEGVFNWTNPEVHLH